MDRGRTEDRGVPLREAAVVLAGCWAVCALTYGVLRAVDEPALPVTAPVVFLLGWWFVNRHRRWVPGAAAFLLGSPVLFLLVDVLRRHLDRPDADALATAAGTLVALAVFTTASRVRPVRRRTT